MGALDDKDTTLQDAWALNMQGNKAQIPRVAAGFEALYSV